MVMVGMVHFDFLQDSGREASGHIQTYIATGASGCGADASGGMPRAVPLTTPIAGNRLPI